MNELLPCNCLEVVLELARQEEEEFDEDDKTNYGYQFLTCSNPDCQVLEESTNDGGGDYDGSLESAATADDDDDDNNDDDDPALFKLCRGCRMVQYCCHRCYKNHWRGVSESDDDTTTPHKVACKAVQELKSFLAGG
jgi:hypothetical protein